MLALGVGVVELVATRRISDAAPSRIEQKTHEAPASVQWAAAGKVCDEACVLTVERVPNESRPNR
jgi:hypothetical protein